MADFAVDPHSLEKLLTYCVDFAKEMLTRCGEFYPFGAVIKTDGGFSAIGGYTGEEHPLRQDVYIQLQESFKQDFTDGKIEAAAIAADVNIPKQYDPPHPDGIRVLIECRGYSRMFYVPYYLIKPGMFGRLIRKRSALTCGEIISVEVDSTLIEKKGNGEQPL